VRGAIRDYEDHHPGPNEIALIVEVADTSLAADRTLATQVYGPAGIPVYWIVNLGDRQVEVYTDPAPAGYLSTAVFPEGQCVPVVIDGQQLGLIAVSDILPSHRTG
jgi:Uma2 family endonuclease